MAIEQQYREQLTQFGRMMYEKGYISGGEGNLSIRLSAQEILITPSGLHKGVMRPEQMIIVNLVGRRINTPNDHNRMLKATSELPMHLEAYKQRPDIHAVIHAHPPYAITLSIANIPNGDDLIPEVVVALGNIPVTPYATPSSEENALAIRAVIRDHDALVLQRHGSLTIGKDLMSAFMRLECIESSARIAYLLAQLGVNNPIPADQMVKLKQQRAMWGLKPIP